MAASGLGDSVFWEFSGLGPFSVPHLKPASRALPEHGVHETGGRPESAPLL